MNRWMEVHHGVFFRFCKRNSVTTADWKCLKVFKKNLYFNQWFHVET